MGDALSLTDLEAFDPLARGATGRSERRFCCPLPACAEKKRDAAHRSLSVNLATGLWRCHRCGESGLLVEFRKDADPDAPPSRRPSRSAGRDSLRRRFALPAEKTDKVAEPPPSPSPEKPDLSHLTTPESVSTGSDEFRRHLTNLTALEGTPGASYLEGRGLPAPFCHRYGVRWSPRFLGRPAVVFPVRDTDEKLVAAQGRYVDGRTDPKARTVGPRKGGVFYAIQPDEHPVPALVVVEAPLDALSLALCGVPCVALCGKDGFPNALRRAVALRTVYAAFDADPEGDKAAEKLAALLAPGGTVTRRLRPEGGKDWNELLLTVGPDALRTALIPALPDGMVADPLYTRQELAQIYAADYRAAHPDASEQDVTRHLTGLGLPAVNF